MKNIKYNPEDQYDKGCWISLNGLYYLSLADDNETNPLDGTGTDPKTWDGGYTKKEMDDLTSCRNADQVVQQCVATACEAPCPTDACVLNIEEIPELCKGEQIKNGDWRMHEGCLYVSCTDIDSAIPFPDSRDWEGPFDAFDILNGSLKPCGSPTLPLELPVWENCTDGEHCVSIYPLDSCVWSMDDDLGKYRIYTSLKADNHDRPYQGSKLAEPSWEGGYTPCDIINKVLNPCREISKTSDNGNFIGG